MSVSLLTVISASSRSRDWRLSLLPFIMGCVYLWMWYFGLPFDGRTLLLVALSLVTATGFAALGYFINEFFDQRHDAMAGKPNRLTPLSTPMQLGLFMAATATAFLPWLWLPADDTSWTLICTQVGLFLLYSLPFPRLKAIPLASNLVDMGYAYVVPLMLSFHTYALFAHGGYPSWLMPLVVTVGLVGFRNILIHQVNDVFNDRRAGMITLPQMLGPKGTYTAFFTLLILECGAFVGFSSMLATGNSVMYALPVLFFLFCIIRIYLLRNVLSPRFLPLEKTRHLTDPFYQLVFPVVLLIALISADWRWVLLLLVHAALLVPAYLFRDALRAGAALRPKISALVWYLLARARHLASCTVNYPIYWLFLLFGVDLTRERKSALGFIRSKFS